MREIDNLLLFVSKIALLRGGTPSTALEIHHEQSKQPNQGIGTEEIRSLTHVCVLCTGRLTTGCPIIDAVLCGGLLLQSITEIAGVSAAGKTQICLQLCLTVQLPLEAGGLAGGTSGQHHSMHGVCQAANPQVQCMCLQKMPFPTRDSFSLVTHLPGSTATQD